MSGNSFKVGSVGQNAIVIQGEGHYLLNYTLQINTVEDAEDVIKRLREEIRKKPYAPILRKLDPIVVFNRRKEIDKIVDFFKDEDIPILFILGLPGIGKSSIARSALEFRNSQSQAIWLISKGLDIEKILWDINEATGLKANPVLLDQTQSIYQKMHYIIGAIKEPVILILDGFEEQLDHEGKYVSESIEYFIQSLVELEHNIKLIVTTRRVPYNAKAQGSMILQLKGLSIEMSKNLFKMYSYDETLDPELDVPPEVYKRLRGHPYFIKLVASGLSEFSKDVLFKELEQYKELEDYVTSQIIDKLHEDELNILCSAKVFRDSFSFESLKFVFEAVNEGKQISLFAIQNLVRKAIFETSEETDLSYFLHQVLRDAVPLNDKDESIIHAAAASCFHQEEIIPSDINSWDNCLYHARRAAQLGENEEVSRYLDYITDIYKDLEYAGWGRRLIQEFDIFENLSENPLNVFLVRFLKTKLFRVLGEKEESLRILKLLSEDVKNNPNIYSNLPKRTLIMLLIYHGEALCDTDLVDEAEKIAKDVAEIVKEFPDRDVINSLRILEIEIGRKRDNNLERLFELALESLEHANKRAEEDPTPNNLNSLAEAHFTLGKIYIDFGEAEKVREHFTIQLLIKLQIGRISGVAAGLTNLALTVYRDLLFSGAALITAQQIEHELEIKPDYELLEDQNKIISKFLSVKENIEKGYKILSDISIQLIPYYERALKRISDNNSP